MIRVAPLAALVGVTAIWGVTFVQVQDAIALYPLFAFLAVRFAISALALAPFAWRAVLALPRAGLVAGLGVGLLLAGAYGFQTAGLDRTTVASTGFITGLYVVFTPLLALRLFGTRVSTPPCIRYALNESHSTLMGLDPKSSAVEVVFQRNVCGTSRFDLESLWPAR